MMPRLIPLIAALSCSASAAVFDYEVVVNTALMGNRGSVMMALFDNSPADTRVAVTDVSGFVAPGPIQTTRGNVQGSLMGGGLVITEGPPANESINGYFEVGALFADQFSFGLQIDTPLVPSRDLFLFGMRSREGGFTSLFSLAGRNQVCVFGDPIVRVTRVSVPEPSAISTLMLLLGGLGVCGVFRQRR